MELNADLVLALEYIATKFLADEQARPYNLHTLMVKEMSLDPMLIISTARRLAGNAARLQNGAGSCLRISDAVANLKTLRVSEGQPALPEHELQNAAVIDLWRSRARVN